MHKIIIPHISGFEPKENGLAFKGLSSLSLDQIRHNKL